MGQFFDSDGFLWVDVEKVSKRGPELSVNLSKRVAEMSTDSYPRTEQPELRDAPPGVLALDFETDDPTLMTTGSSWAFPGRGEILGMAIAWEGFQAYYPIAHRCENVEREPVINWLRDHLSRPDVKFVCANASYDLGWGKRETNLYPAGGAEDVLFGAALLDENRYSYSLEAVAQDHMNCGKETSILTEIEKRLSIKHTQLMSNLKHLPGGVVASYAAMDARRTFDLRNVLMEKMNNEELLAVHNLESSLIPMSTEMRRLGIRVDVEGAAALAADIKNVKIPALQNEIQRICGVWVEPWEAETCERALETIGVVCKRTSRGPQVDAPLLNSLADQPIAAHILEMRKMSKAGGTFLEGYILGHEVNGRIHPSFNQLRAERDDGSRYGTVSGRYSSTDPNLQNIPVRDPVWGSIIRSFFLPEEGEEFASLDFKAQEPRLALHFAYLAKLEGSIEAVQRYHDDPNTDYHQMVAEICNIQRGYAKTINLGLGYGMGGAKLARSLGLPTEWMWVRRVGSRNIWTQIQEHEVPGLRSQGYDCVEVAGPEARAIIEKWEKGAPFLRGLYDLSERAAQVRGYIKTILGRRCRFAMDGTGGYSWTHKSMNRLCQGSAADQTKKGMLNVWNAGYCPSVSIHDELLFSVPDREYAQRFVPYMEEAVQLVVPSVIDIKMGKNWGAIPK